MGRNLPALCYPPPGRPTRIELTMWGSDVSTPFSLGGFNVSMHSDEDVEIVALIELPTGLLEGRFTGSKARRAPGRQGIVGRALWGLLAGLLKQVPCDVPFSLSVMANGLMFNGPDLSSELLTKHGHPICENWSAWTWTFVSNNGKEVH